LRSDYPALTIVLVDNASDDGSGARLHARFPNVEFVQTGANLGFTGGNNRGLERAMELGADYLLVLNNDTIVDAACISTLVSAAELTRAAAVAPRILYHGAPDRIWYGGGDFKRWRAIGVHRREGMPNDGSDRAGPITFVTGCCFLWRASVYRDLGGFAEHYFIYVEDAELSVRMTRAGHALWYEPRATLLHRVPMTTGAATPFQIRQRDRNRRRLVRTHYTAAELLAFACWFYPTRALHLTRYLVSGRWPEARAILVGAFGTLRPTATPSSEVQTRRPI